MAEEANSSVSLVDQLLGLGTKVYQTATGTDPEKLNASNIKRTTAADVEKSKTLKTVAIIGGGVLIVVVVLFLMFGRGRR